MKLIIVIFCSFFAFAVRAQVTETTVQCKRDSKSQCTERIVAAFEKLGCNPIVQSVHCQDAATDPLLDPSEMDEVQDKEFCRIESECHEPHYGNFGQVTCGWTNPQEQTLRLKNVDKGITLTTSVGLFRRYVTTLCK